MLIKLECGRGVAGVCAFPDSIIIHSFTLPQKSWITLLSIAHRYEFLDVRERAINEIYSPFQVRARQARLDSILMSKEKVQEIQQELQQEDYQGLISVAEKYDVPFCHIVPLLLPFVMRVQPLTMREVSGFSTLTVTRLAHAREDFLRKRRSKTVTVTRPDAEVIVHKVWQAVVENDGTSATHDDVCRCSDLRVFDVLLCVISKALVPQYPLI
jgi:hypothetical protein